MMQNRLPAARMPMSWKEDPTALLKRRPNLEAITPPPKEPIIAPTRIVLVSKPAIRSLEAPNSIWIIGRAVEMIPTT
jgi:hypothetical protein